MGFMGMLKCVKEKLEIYGTLYVKGTEQTINPLVNTAFEL